MKKDSTSERISSLSSSDRKLWSHLKRIVDEDESNIMDALGPDVQVSKREIKRELREEETASSKEDTDFFFTEFEKKKGNSPISSSKIIKEREQMESERQEVEHERPSMLDALKMLNPKEAAKREPKRTRTKSRKKGVDTKPVVPSDKSSSDGVSITITTSSSQLRRARKDAKLFFSKRIKSDEERKKNESDDWTGSKADNEEADEKWWERSREERMAIIALRTPLKTSADDELKRIQNDRVTRFGIHGSSNNKITDKDWRSHHRRITDIHNRIDKCATQVQRNRDSNVLSLRRATEIDHARLLSQEKEVLNRAHKIVAQVTQYCTSATSRISPDRNRLSSELLTNDSYRSTLPYVSRHLYNNPSDAGLNLPGSLFSSRRERGALMFRRAYAFEPGNVSGSTLRRHVQDATSYVRVEGNISDIRAAMRGQ